MGLVKSYLLIIFLFIFFYIYSSYKIIEPPVNSHIMNCSLSKRPAEGKITGRISRVDRYDGYIKLTVKNCTVRLTYPYVCDAKNINVIINCSLDLNLKSMPQIDDYVTVEGKIRLFDEPTNEGEFDKRTYYRSIGIAYRVSADTLIITGHVNDPLNDALNKIKNKVTSVYKEALSEKDAGIYSSIILGNRNDLDIDTKKLYQAAGIAHLLAISGLHIALMGMSLYKLLRKTGMQLIMAGVIGILFILFYGRMTGFSVSCVRAVIMFIMSVTADMLGRTYDIRSAMSLALIYVVLDNPYVIYNSGFCLSFGAIAGICIVFTGLRKIICIDNMKSKILKKIINALLVSISVSITTLPIILYFYFEVPVYSFLCNLIVIPLMTIVVISSVLTGLTGMVIINAASFMSGAAHYVLMLYDYVCLASLKLPCSIHTVGRPDIRTIVIYYICLCAGIGIVSYKWTYTARVNKGYNIRNIIAFCLIAAAILNLLVKPDIGKLQIRMIDVGQGDAILMQTPNGVNYLFDGGSLDVKGCAMNRLLPVIKSNGISRLDYVVISHTDEDHINGIVEMINDKYSNIIIKNMVLPLINNPDEAYCELVKLAEHNNIPVLYVNTGAQIGNDTVSIRCIHPVRNYEYDDKNDYSACFLITYGSFDMMMLGDAGHNAEASILKNNKLKNIDILKTAHHGSQSSSGEKFLDLIRPKAAIISAGRNNIFNHPARSTLERFDQINAKYYVTSECGEIIITTDGNVVNIKKYVE